MGRLISYKSIFSTLFYLSAFFNVHAQWQDILLDENWLTSLNNTNAWRKVDIPHNWDDYYGYRRLTHGNLHGEALYKREFIALVPKNSNRFFLFFEGVGSYASVWLNGQFIGSHAGGRTSFTLDITDAIRLGGIKNELLVKAGHPAFIKDLPWVCGGCSDDRGFSEGSQPLGIFRPVHLLIKGDVNIQPFGVHAWADIKDSVAILHLTTAIKSYSPWPRRFDIIQELLDANGNIVAKEDRVKYLEKKDSQTISSKDMQVKNPVLWSLENPYCYRILTIIKENATIVDSASTTFGFRTIEWKTPSHQFLLNGKPVFINGVGEYEHMIGGSHAFSNEEILSRMKWVQFAGFNAFRDAHQPHNLAYGKLCNQLGLLWWAQFSAHIWFDSPAFRDNFKKLLRDWVMERRNDPALILWGLQNESILPADFAKECSDIIRSLDPTASTQRLITTCNGGEGTDWNVPQNWSGTYGGDPSKYATELKKQVLVGEYGAWRTIGLHTEGGFVQNGVLSEDRETQLLEKKIDLAESVKDSVAGQFFWLLASHDNPGRVQGGEGLRELDRIGPVNYKGLLSSWEEPTDAFYLFRSHSAPKEKEPMVYIVSHTWPQRWMQPGIKDSIVVFSNCDEVELFNDINANSLGRKKRIGARFQWDHANIQYNILYAIGYVNGKAVAKDTIVLNHLPQAPHFESLYDKTTNITKPADAYNYVYRVNCGGPTYKDVNGNTWLADKPLDETEATLTWFSKSWELMFPGMPSFFASQGRTFSPIKGTRDWKLFQDFRYGKSQLSFHFPVPNGEYLVELYFIEPWLGNGGGMDASGMRLFDVAINRDTVLTDLDIWKEAGTNTVLKKTVTAKVTGGHIDISFPQTKSGQAIISAIAIASLEKNIKPSRLVDLIKDLHCNGCTEMNWLDIGNEPFANKAIEINELPPNLYGANWILQAKREEQGITSFTVKAATDIFIAYALDNPLLAAIKDFEDTKTVLITDEDGGKKYEVYRKRFLSGSTVSLPADSNMILMFLPVSDMPPAFDLKPVTTYRADAAIIGAGATKEQVNGREAIIVTTDQRTEIAWPIQMGVADKYSITVKYHCANADIGNVVLLDAGGNRMLDQPVNFTITKEGKWSQFTITTKNMINAGHYQLKLEVNNAKGLAISGIDLQ